MDQGLSSLTNLAGSVLAARALSSADFGAVAVGFSCGILVVGLSRSWTSEPLVIRYAGKLEGDFLSQATGVSILIGSLAAALLALAATLAQPPLAAVLVLLGVSAPGLILQDFCRLVLIAKDRQRSAAVNDGIWLTATLLMFAFGHVTVLAPWVAFACWSVGASVAACIGLAQLRLYPALRSMSAQTFRDWGRRQRDLSQFLCAEFVVTSGVGFVLTVGVAAVGGLDESAGLRGASILMAPLNVLMMGVAVQLLPKLSRCARSDRSKVHRLASQASLALAGLGAVWGLAVIGIPDPVGRLLLGESWASSQEIVEPLVVYHIASCASIGALYGLRALSDVRRSFRLRLVLSPIVLVFGLVGASAGGAYGASWGIALGATVSLPVLWTGFLTSSRGNTTLDGLSGYPMDTH